MGEAIPSQHPAVVLRSRFNQLRAILAAAIIAVVGLTVAVVILANDSDQVGTQPAVVSAPPASPSSATAAKHEAATAAAIGQSFGGTSSATAAKNEAATAAAIGQSTGGASSATEAKNEAGTAAAIGQSNGAADLPVDKQYGTSQYRFAQPEPGTQLDDEAQEARRTDPHGPASATP